MNIKLSTFLLLCFFPSFIQAQVILNSPQVDIALTQLADNIKKKLRDIKTDDTLSLVVLPFMNATNTKTQLGDALTHKLAQKLEATLDGRIRNKKTWNPRAYDDYDNPELTKFVNDANIQSTDDQTYIEQLLKMFEPDYLIKGKYAINTTTGIFTLDYVKVYKNWNKYAQAKDFSIEPVAVNLTKSEIIDLGVYDMNVGTVTFEAHMLNSPVENAVTYTFVSGNRIYLYFRTPVQGYASVYYVSPIDKLAYIILPYYNEVHYNKTYITQVNANQKYIFFNDDQSILRPQAPNQKIEEYVYVMFSENKFDNPFLDYYQDYELYASQYNTFETWVNNLPKKYTIQIQKIKLEITPK